LIDFQSSSSVGRTTVFEAAVIQWIRTNCDQGFLHAMKNRQKEYEKKEKDESSGS